jgi:hypothetical protein
MEQFNTKVEKAGTKSHEEGRELAIAQGKELRKLDELELMLVGGGDCVVCW